MRSRRSTSGPNIHPTLRQFLRQFLPFVRPYSFRLGLGILSGILFGCANAALLVVVRLVCDLIFPTLGAVPGAESLHNLPGFLRGWATRQAATLGQMDRPWLIACGIALVPTVMLFRSLFQYLGTYSACWAATRTMADVQRALFRHLQSLSLNFFGETRSGELMSRVSNDPIVLYRVVSEGFTVAIREPVQILVLGTVLAVQQPRLTAVSLVLVPLCVVPVAIFGRKVRKAAKAAQTHVAEQNSVMNESFGGQRVVKAYNLETFMNDRFLDASRKYVSELMRTTRGLELPGPMIEFFGSLGVAGVFAYIAFYSKVTLSAGDFLQFIGGVFMLYKPIKDLSRLQALLQQAAAASQRVFALLETKSQLKDPPVPVPLKAAGADIVFEHIRFSYGDRTVIHDLNLTVPSGKVVALVGMSGSGKTTLTSLLLRFHDPEAGRITIGGVDLRDTTTAGLRDQIAVVTQDVVLFSDSIARNIELGRQGASRAEIELAAKAAYADGFIREKPLGYDTPAGERGTALSGGQRQRIAIARALLRNAPILILDEATSALDTESERAVQDALETLMKGRTTICIAHRLSTIQKADRIVVMDSGRIVEQGTHAELVARGGHYARLHALQFGGE